MLILDTNVVSELMREEPNEAVAAWLGKQKPFHLATTSVTVAEIQRGLKRLPRGKRRSGLEASFDLFMEQGFEGRIFPFDEQAARAYGEICAKREKQGLGVGAVDMMIASIAHNTGAILATRNVDDFAGCGIKFDNPWS